ncbi:uncharacterized protein LOC124283685 [Haliotis rubra]|uniref:uncharacterized protein LOC124283685 n=1 Tax=Haliotis rubra TaxID=36100 RepID=UPI001EE58548|nr:uncharacterized protein LOC124283685 [Haliotis rubra]
MSLNPNLGHLYHDSSIGGTLTSIDAREQLRMREINKREQRYLAHHTCILDRAKGICDRSRRWEQENVKQQIKKIKEKTLSLEKNLRQEAKRTADHQIKSSVTSAPCLVSRKSIFANIPREVKSASDLTVSPTRHVVKTNSFQKRSNHVARALLKLYSRSDERRRQSLEQPNQLDPAQLDVLHRARVVLKGTEAEDQVMKMLGGASRGRRSLPTHLTSKQEDFRSGRKEHGSSSGDSELDVDVHQASWTRFTKLPEIWKQATGTKSGPDVNKPKLVTITAKYRKSRVC